jgi:phosphatidylglycerophosphate synthase
MQVFFYAANLIDYFRYFLVLRGMNYAFVEENWVYFIWYYYVAIAMDVIDGAFARLLDQVTRFGTCLDMVCDRASVSVMYFVLGQVYPSLETLLIFFFILDYGSHFLQFTANALAKNTSHKNMDDPNENMLVKLYYGNKFVFVLLACGADNGLVIAFVNGRYTEMTESWKWNLLVAITSFIIVLK